MSVSKKMPDIDIFLKLKSGNTKAFELIYHKYWSKLFDQAYKRLADEEIVKEFIQELFTELWQNREVIQIHTSISSYLHQALKFKIYNYYKLQQVQDRYRQFVYEQHGPHSTNNLTEERINYIDLHQALKKSIEKLPNQTRRAYKLKQEGGLTYPEIAAVLKISTSTVEKHIIKALKVIRRELKHFIWLLFTIFLK
ncbi:sigma-70 family RNA polymerase sigma factor [Olivibacter sp. LS-1]|uniref:sigma-70 family RNA polymerase sigma factor n=1 Tax=Olivibacter sp. LS-1 TaxID=2592345 RepID=UPI0011EB3B32|nr:sigma-70 family RNA polymerase sigma factor [Olivibacter sp. LS-1]QEL03519.1 sigma-70 family RNA polymerase sigma factor [Olivibacter sp. LS-1]